MRATCHAATALVLAAAASAAAAPSPTWTTVSMPLDRAAFGAVAAIDPSLPRALLLPQAIRVLHEADQRGSDLRQRVVAALRAAPASVGATAVPLPLDVSTWCRAVLPRCRPETVVADLLDDRSGSLVYLGLAGVDDSTRAFLSSAPELLTWIARGHAGAFAAFGDSLRIHAGQIVVPGGAEAAPAWEALAGASTAQPSAFIRGVIANDRGRLAYFFDTAAHLDAAHLRFALGPDARATALMAAAFAAIDPSWDVEARPFIRPLIDPATVLLRVQVDADGRLAGIRSRAFWDRALDPDAEDAADRAVRPAEGDADAAWLVARVAGSDTRRRMARLQALLYGQRLAARLDRDGIEDAVRAVRASMRMPALVFSLERAGVTDVGLIAALVRHARTITAIADANERAGVLNEWQGAIALVVRLSLARTLDAPTTAALLSDLAALAPRDGRLHDAVARWLAERVLPALPRPHSGGAAEAPDANAPLEQALLDALAGPSTAGPAIAWEGSAYSVDVAGAEREHLAAIRARQDTPGVDTALASFALVAALAEPAPTSRADALLAQVNALLDLLPPRSTPGGAVTETVQVLGRLARALDARPPDPRWRERDALERASEHLLGEALRSLVYAVALGSPDDRLFLAGDVSARHDFGADRPGMPPGPSPPWSMPVEQAASGQPWHVRGSLLGLDVALGRLSLRRLLGQMPVHQALIGASQRGALVQTMVLTEPSRLADEDRQSILEAMERGRARIAAAVTDEDRAALCRDAGLCGWRGEILAWVRANEPGALLSTASRAELTWAGWTRTAPPPDAWGAATTIIDGRLGLRFPDAWPIELAGGRPTLAFGLTGFVDLKLRVAEHLAALGLPAVLARDVLAAALQDFIDEAQPGFAEDWISFARLAHALSKARVEDYVSALTIAGGPLAPREAPGTAR